MSVGPEITSTGDFLATATRLELLTPEASRKLFQEATQRSIGPAQLALEQGLLNATDVDIVETLRRPHDAVSGYEILSVLGRGGMGVVFRARQKNLDRIVALKTVLLSRMSDSNSVARFEQEAIAVARLKHPNIVTAYDFGRHSGRLFLVMECVEGESLDQLLARQGRLDEATAWGIARQAASALAHAAAVGIVHRDVKPANLLLVTAPEGSPLPPGLPMVKLTDLGVALLRLGSESDSRITAAGSTVGSPQYMAPEQLEGSDVDCRADIYALGATMFHMLAGEPAFRGKSPAQLIVEKLSGESPRLRAVLPDASGETDDLVAAMMTRDPTRRIGNYRELIERIDRLPISTSAAPVPRASIRLPAMDTVVPTTTTLAAVPATRRHTLVRQFVATLAGQPSRRRWLLLGAFVLLFAIVCGWLCLRPTGGGGPLAESPLVESGWSQFLYDGSTLKGWETVVGSWSHGRDTEGGKILAGRGCVRRVLPQPQRPDNAALRHYRVRVLVDLHQASAVELQFAVLAPSSRQQPRYVLRITPQEVVLGRRAGESAALEPMSQAIAPAKSADPDAGPAYHELQIERRTRGWWAFCDGQPLAALPLPDGQEALEFLLVTEGGPAMFDAPEIAELVPADRQPAVVPK